MQHFLANIVVDRPITGFAASIGITGAGFWTFVEGATKIGGFFIMCVGLGAALLNWQVQRLAKRKAELEFSRARLLQESTSATSQAQGRQDSSSP